MLSKVIVAVLKQQNRTNTFVNLTANKFRVYSREFTSIKSSVPLKDVNKDKDTSITPATTKTSRLIRQKPGPVILGFIPKEWFLFFLPKTGVTGFGTFLFTVSTTLISKEIYVLEHEYYNGMSMVIFCAAATKYIGADVAKYIDKGIDEYEASWNEGRNATKKTLENLIEHEKQLQYSSDGQLMLIAAKRENVALQQEAAYRERLMHVYKESKKRLDHAVAQNAAEMKFIHKHIAMWVIEKVNNSLTSQLEDVVLMNCLDHLEFMAKQQLGEPQAIKLTM